MSFDPLVTYCGEMPGYPIQIATPKGPLTHRCLDVYYSDIGNWLNYFVNNPGDPYAGGPLPPLLVSYRVQPMPGQKILQSWAPGVASYKHALLYLDYSGIGTTLHAGTVVQESITPSYEAMHIDPTGLEWSGGASIGSTSPPIMVVPCEHYSIYYPMSPNVGTSIAPGSVNSDSFTSYVLGRTFSPGTLLYEGSDVQISASWVGTTKWSVRCHAKWKPSGWNKFWNSAIQTWDTVKLTGGATYNQYPAVTFTGHI